MCSLSLSLLLYVIAECWACEKNIERVKAVAVKYEV